MQAYGALKNIFSYESSTLFLATVFNRCSNQSIRLLSHAVLQIEKDFASAWSELEHMNADATKDFKQRKS